jgi:hypothetical protein
MSNQKNYSAPWVEKLSKPPPWVEELAKPAPWVEVLSKPPPWAEALKRRDEASSYSFASLNDLYSRKPQPLSQPTTMKETLPPNSEAARRHQERIFNAPPRDFLEAYKRMQKADPVMKDEIERVGELFPRLAENYHFLQLLVRLYMDYVKELEAQINDYGDLPQLPQKGDIARRLIAEFEARWGRIRLEETKPDKERT